MKSERAIFISRERDVFEGIRALCKQITPSTVVPSDRSLLARIIIVLFTRPRGTVVVESVLLKTHEFGAKSLNRAQDESFFIYGWKVYASSFNLLLTFR